MSENDILDETFGDISLFVYLSKNHGQTGKLAGPSNTVSPSELVVSQEIENDSSNIVSGTYEEMQFEDKISREQTLFPPKHDIPNIDSFDTTTIAGPSVQSYPQEHAETSSTIKDASDVGSVLGSWSGPESSSDPEIWGASDSNSWFDSRHDNNAQLNANTSNHTHSQEKVGETEVEDDVENSINLEERHLPDDDPNVEHGLESNLSNNSKGVQHFEQDSNLIDILGQVEVDFGENEDLDCGDEVVIGDSLVSLGDNSADAERSDNKLDDKTNSILTDIENVGTDKDDNDSDVDSPEVENLSDSLNNPIVNELGTKDTLEEETELQDLSDADTNTVDSDKVSTQSQLQEDGVSDIVNTVDSDSLNMDGETSSVNDNRIPSEGEEHDEDDLSVVVLPAQVTNSQGSLSNNAEVAVNMNDDHDLNIREEDNEPGWTILEVWSLFAVTAGALPYWISNDGRQTQVNRSNACTILWGFSLIIYAAEFIYVIPKVASILGAEASSEAFMQLGIQFSFVIFRIACIRTAMSKVTYLVDANNRVLTFPQTRTNNWKSGSIFFLLISVAIINTLLFIVFKTHIQLDFAEIKVENILQKLECVGKKQLMMSIACSPTTNQSFVQIAWALTGFLITAHKVTMGTVVVLGIIILSLTLLFVSYNIDESGINCPNGVLAHITPNHLTNITKLAEDMSQFIGEALLGYLIYHAIYTPSELLFIFSGSSYALLSLLLNHGTIYAGLILSSVASLRIKRISDSISSQDNIVTQQPVRPGTAIIVAYISEIISRKSVGIGLPGVFVINFKITLSYMGVVGTFLALLLQ